MLTEEQKARNRAKQHRYYLAHKAEIAERTRKYRQAHPEKVKAWNKAFYLKQAEKAGKEDQA